MAIYRICSTCSFHCAMEALKQIKKDKKKPTVILKSEVKNYSNDPFFIKKRERAKEVLDKYGIPEHFLTNSK